MPLLNQAYDQDNYLAFLAKKFVFSKTLVDLTINNDAVKIFKCLGFITTADKKKLLVFEIHIDPATQLARNRVQLRHLVAREIKAENGVGAGDEDGALAVYVDRKNKQWRFSFISIEHIFGEDGVQTEETASKRFTYLLGEGAKTRTATEQFSKLNQQSTLDDLKDAFAVEALSKEFYGKLYRWYETAQTQVTFPNDEQANNHTQTSLIHLLTRLLFVWFIKEKGLINADLFELAKLKNIIDYQKPSSFYKAILQNLFFATLNVEIKKRDFRAKNDSWGRNENYGDHYRYRYHNLVKDVEKWQQSFSQTPFLNGGLFECLDIKLDKNILDGNNKPIKDEAGNKIINQQHKKLIDQWTADIRPEKRMIRMEGFSDRTDNELQFDNQLLFNDDEKNLGLIDLFNQYQFTVEESTPTDIDVALDPELLGKVFENLLATYNPETKQLDQDKDQDKDKDKDKDKDRKASGSFYTPREIVGYMVDTSLKAYLSQAVPPDDGDNEFYQQRLDDLFFAADNNAADNTAQLATGNGTSLIYPNEIPKLIDAISQIKIIDPAVGSGAFPMGILQRLVALLAILDPDNKQWKAQQLAILPSLKSIEQDIKTSQKINDTQAKQKARAELERRKKQITAQFKQQDHNYLRKLYLIENCIYGVDIKPIAILIAQLRFFISLTIEQQHNSDKSKNYGIQPLPNLDYHFEVGNSLVGLPENYRSAKGDDLLKSISPLKHQVFSESRHNKKTEMKIAIKKKTDEYYQEIKESIGYEINFDFRINFFEVFDTANDGFDIVIGNPPYIRHESIKEFKPQFEQSFSVFTGTADIYTYFYEKGVNLLNDNGHLCYITSNKWMRTKYGEKLRVFFKQQTGLKQIIDFGGKQIFKATVDTNILLCGTSKTDSFNYQKQLPDKENPLLTMKTKDLSDKAYILQAPEILALKKKIEQIGTPLKEWDININFGIKTGFNPAFIIDTDKRNELVAQDPKAAEIIKPILRGRDIKAYEHHWAEKWIIFIPWHFPLHQDKSIKGNSSIAEKAFLEQYPVIYNHLLHYKEKLSKRNKAETGIRYEWYAMQRCANTYINEFEKEKLVWKRIGSILRFAYYEDKTYCLDSTCISTGNSVKFLCAFLNSTLGHYLLQNSPKTGTGDLIISVQALNPIPVPKIPKPAQQPFINLVDKILIAKKTNQDSSDLEAQIDKLVYKLYNLTAAEIKILKNENG